MQSDSPYQLVKPLGSSQVGTVWSAVDAGGRLLTVAVLDADVASDQRWRDAFITAANGLQPHPDGRRYLDADFVASAPWVICVEDGGPGAEQVFLALGADYQPVPPEAVNSPARPPEAANPPAQPPQVEMPRAQPVQTGDSPTQPPEAAMPPAQPPEPSPTATADQQAVMPMPVSTPPDSNRGPSQQVPVVPSSPYPLDPLTSPVRRIEPSPPRGRPTRLWIAIAALVILILIGGGTVFALTRTGGTAAPPASPARSTTAAPLPTPSPLHPGLEPPRPGDWPTKWPKFGNKDKVKTIGLDGVSFTLAMPAGWNCVRAGSSEGSVRYNCGTSLGANQEIGGELTVRTCPAPCDVARQDTMRKVEEAWGLQWRFAGQGATLAETLKLNGASRYGIVLVAYFHGTPLGPIDHQLVLRMTAPVTWVDEIRKVANSVRDGAKF
jgi:hypothetical protein